MIEFDKYLSHLSRDKYVIYLFHGVVIESNYEIRNYTKKHIEREDFNNLISKLKSVGNPISMDEVLYNYQYNIKPPPYSYAITFDDGFENNLTVAAPILDEQKTPATFYVSTDLIENNTITWTDQIELCLEKVSKGSVKLPFENDTSSFHDRKTKKIIMDNLRSYLKSNLHIDPSKIVNLFYETFNLELITSGEGPLDKKMNWEQVKSLNNNQLFEVAGHSHRHVSLTSLSPSQLENEIDTSIRLLLKKSNIDSIHYAYPEGQEIDYSEEVIKCLKKKGIKCCPTAIHGVNDFKVDPFHLKRIFVDK